MMTTSRLRQPRGLFTHSPNDARRTGRHGRGCDYAGVTDDAQPASISIVINLDRKIYQFLQTFGA